MARLLTKWAIAHNETCCATMKLCQEINFHVNANDYEPNEREMYLAHIF